MLNPPSTARRQCSPADRKNRTKRSSAAEKWTRGAGRGREGGASVKGVPERRWRRGKSKKSTEGSLGADRGLSILGRRKSIGPREKAVPLRVQLERYVAQVNRNEDSRTESADGVYHSQSRGILYLPRGTTLRCFVAAAEERDALIPLFSYCSRVNRRDWSPDFLLCPYYSTTPALLPFFLFFFFIRFFYLPSYRSFLRAVRNRFSRRSLFFGIWWVYWSVITFSKFCTGRFRLYDGVLVLSRRLSGKSRHWWMWHDVGHFFT